MYKTKEAHNAYHKIYQLNRYHKRKQDAIAKLGGMCVQCSAVDHLEIDHIDWRNKEFNLSRLWSVSEKAFQEELSKCQLLCRSCHELKSRYDLHERLGQRVFAEHGTLSMYDKGCRCKDCYDCKSLKNKEYNMRR